MRLTNKLNLPQPIVDAVSNDSYDNGGADISVTGLLRPPRIATLERVYKDELTEDVSDRMWSLLGQVVHGILERADTSGIVERRLTMKVQGWTISGQMDRYENGKLQDYKFVSVWKIKKGVPQEYEEQLNCYAELLRRNNHNVTELELVCILRDWSKQEARRDPEYPQAQVVNMKVNLWPQEYAQEFISKRVALHKRALKELLECTPADTWARPDVWALMKKGRKTALKLYNSELAAVTAVDKPVLYVEYRPGEAVRCESYCPVSKFCTQYQQTKTKASNRADQNDEQENENHDI